MPCTVVLKLEHLQHTGSFKARGAFANLLLRDVPDVGVAAASGGNHGAAVAYAARRLGVRARVFVPGYSSPAKVDRIRRYGAELVVGGDDIGDSFAACTAWSAESGALEVHPYDQRETMLGTGTLAAELEEQAGPVDRVLVGGRRRRTARRHRVVVRRSRRRRRCRARRRADAAPRARRGRTRRRPDRQPGRRLARTAPTRRARLPDRWRAGRTGPALVDDAAIAEAQHRLWDRLRIVVEPGGATAFASLVAGVVTPRPGERIAVDPERSQHRVDPVRQRARSVPTMSGKFVKFVQTGNLVFVSGHIANRDGEPWLDGSASTSTPSRARKRRPASLATSSTRCRKRSATSTESPAS